MMGREILKTIAIDIKKLQELEHDAIFLLETPFDSEVKRIANKWLVFAQEAST